MIPSKHLNRILSFVYFTIFWLSTHISYAQGLCDKNNWPPNAVEGGFKIDGDISAGCTPMAVRLKDMSGGSDIRYDFYYDGKAANLLDKVGNKDSTNLALFSNPNSIRYYTILQYGKKNGKDMFACKTVSVRPNNQPVFSYSTCNNNFLNLIIPQDPANNFDYYTIEWGDNSAIQTVTSLPFTANKSYGTTTPTRSIRVKGENNTPTGCQPPPFQTINMDSDGNVPKITELEVLPGGTKAKLSFSGTFDTHQIYQRTPSQNYSFPNFKYQANPGTITVDLINNQQTCFMIYKYTACAQLSGEVCTIQLDSIQIFGPNINTLSWQTIAQNQTSSILNTSTIKNINYDIDWQEIENNNILIQKIYNVNPTYGHTIAKCSANYCYQIIAKVEGEWSVNPAVPYSSISKSEIKCIDRKSVITPPITDVNVNVLADDKIELSFTDNSNWSVNKAFYFLYEASPNGFIKRDSLTPASQKKFNVNADATKASLCYQLGYSDVCGSNSKLSGEICTIHLLVNNKEELIWTDVSPFGASGINNFELISIDENTGIESLQNTVPSSQLMTQVDLSNYEIEAQFKIKALNANGMGSYSNTVSIPIEALFFVPDAFSPDDNQLNDTFEIKGRLGRVKTYDLKIFDRWGANIIQIKDKNQNWDGNITLKPLSGGIYTFQLKIELNNGENIYKIGKFEVLK
ncbi:hypothetical protein EGI24_12635 [Lacihabitans sp. CS3-21]|nr:hypothetical protein [Lacihabitans sp. CS3-21]